MGRAYGKGPFVTAVLVLLLITLVVGIGVLAFGGWTGGATVRRRVVIERDPFVDREVSYSRPVRRRRIVEEDVRADW